MMEYIPQYTCPNPACDGAVIPTSNVVVSKQAAAKAYFRRRMVAVKCQHCEQVHQVEQVQSSGFWQNCDKVERVTAPAEIAGIQKAIDKACGTLQRMAS